MSISKKSYIFKNRCSTGYKWAKESMRKIISFILLALMSFSMLASTVVYVRGEWTPDGVDVEECYWKNGNIGHFKEENNRGILTMAVDKGDVYYCIANNVYYNNSYHTVYKIFKNNEELYSFTPKEKHNSITCMKALNGNVYIGLEERGDNYGSQTEYSLVKNGRYEAKVRNAGQLMDIANGMLYYTLHWRTDVTGYCAGGSIHKFENQTCFPANKIRVDSYDNNVMLFASYSFKINDAAWRYFDKFDGYDRCIDWIDKRGASFYLMNKKNKPDEKSVLYGWQGEDIFAGTTYKPIAIEQKDGILYVLATMKQRGLDVCCVVTYDIEKRTIIGSTAIPQCRKATQIIVVDE